MSYNEEEIESKADELRRLLEDPKVMHELMKDAYIPVGRSTVEMLEEILQNDFPPEESPETQNEP